jgi:DNA-binding transcriptional ArsR family regulator
MLHYNNLDRFFAVAEPTRRSILEFIARKKELSATQIYNFIQNQTPVTPPAISQHLKILREAKLVDVQKRGQQRIYTINPAGFAELQEWVKKMAQFYERFEALA